MKKQNFLLYPLLLLGVFLVFASSCEKEIMPVVTTTAVSNITHNTATSGGDITDEGSSTVISRGVCWSTGTTPTLSDNKTTDGAGAGNFVSNMSGLSANTTFYVRAYATNNEGTGYGMALTLTTQDETPVLATTEIYNIKITTASSGGNITSDGGFTITARGVCWSTNNSPTISDNITKDGEGTGNFVSTIVGLSENTTYYVRAYATNSIGTEYGNVTSFTTQDWSYFIDDRDGKRYKTVKIGTQTWMAENLAYLPSVVGSGTVSNATTPYHYVYGYNGTSVSEAKTTSNYQTYGVLYNWHAALNACPAGWHLPTDSEWKALEMHLGTMGTNQGSKLAGNAGLWTDGALVNDEDFGTSDFTALPGGLCAWNGNSYHVGDEGYWWSATELDTDDAWPRFIFNYSASLLRSSRGKELGLSVRCLRDSENTIIAPTVSTAPPTDINETSATVGGEVTDDGGSTVTERGVYYSTSTSAETTGTKLQIGSGSGTFSTSLTGITENTTYYIKAYATNGEGTAYGNEESFTTATVPGDDDNPVINYTTNDLGQLIAVASGDIIVEIKEKVVNGNVYLGVITGSTVEATPSLFKYNGSAFENVWTCDDLSSSTRIHYAINSSGESFVAGYGDSLCIYKREGSSWSQDIAPDNIIFYGMEVFNDELYLLAKSNDVTQVMKYNGASWDKIGENIASGSIYDSNIETVDGSLYVHYSIDNTLHIKHLSGNSWASDLEWTQEYLSNTQLAKNGGDLYFSTSTNSTSAYDGGVYRVTGSTSVENLIPDGAADSWFLQGAFTMSVDNDGNLIASSIKGEKVSETEVILYPHLILYDGSQWNTVSGDFTDGRYPIGISTTGTDIFYFYGEKATQNSSQQSTVLKTKKLTK